MWVGRLIFSSELDPSVHISILSNGEGGGRLRNQSAGNPKKDGATLGSIDFVTQKLAY